LACLKQEGRLTQKPNGKWQVASADYVWHINSNRVVLISTSTFAGFRGYPVIDGIQRALENIQRQLHIICRYKYCMHNIKTQVIPGLREAEVHGVLLNGAFSKECQREYCISGHPVVLVDTPPKYDRIASVCVANEDAAYDTVQRLAHLGHRRIAFYRRFHRLPAEVDPDSAERQKGFLKGLKNCGITNTRDVIFNGIGLVQTDATVLRKLLLSRPRFTAVICVDDQLAECVFRAALDSGLIVPRDLSIASFGSLYSKWSGQHIDLKRVGREAVELVESRKFKQLYIPTIWYEGSSLGEPLSAKRR
jgi:DNA-binding LacI/PurR family transcriptional regulator